MARYYISTLDINVWKEHTCAGCGTAYRYLLKRKKSARGGTPEAATANSRAMAAKAVANEVDFEPCPACGLYQPDMVGAWRSRAHWLTFALGLVALLVVLIAACASGYEGRRYAPALAAGVCLLVGAIHLLVDRRNPNRNLDANLHVARQRLDAGRLSVSTETGAAEGGHPGGGWSVANMMAYALFAVAAAAFLTAEGLRTVEGQPVNADEWPPVAGAGDETTVYLPQRITSIKSYWNGQAKVQVVNAKEIGLPEGFLVPATTNTASWGGTIESESGDEHNVSQLWVKLHLPTTPDLGGKTLRLQIDMSVRYPEAQGAGFDDATQNVSHTTTLQVASSARAGEQYEALWWGGVIGGVALTMTAGVWLAVLAGLFKRQALPTQIYVPNVAR
jgi:hypothetical protein